MSGKIGSSPMSTPNSASGSKTNLSLSYLGAPQITRAISPITNFISNKVPALLAYLAVTRRAHSRDKLAALHLDIHTIERMDCRILLSVHFCHTRNFD